MCPPPPQTRNGKVFIASGGYDGRILLHEVSGSVRMVRARRREGGRGGGAIMHRIEGGCIREGGVKKAE